MFGCQLASLQCKKSQILRSLQILAILAVIASSSVSHAQKRDRQRDRDNSGAVKAGRIIGGVAGIILGSKIGDSPGEQIAAAAGLGILGAVVGGEIAEHFSERDERESAHCLNEALSSDYREGHYYDWNGDQYRGNIRFTRHGQFSNGIYCREFHSRTYYPNGAFIEKTGYFCQQNGYWSKRDDDPWLQMRHQDNMQVRPGPGRGRILTPYERAQIYCDRVATSQRGYERCMRDQRY